MSRWEVPIEALSSKGVKELMRLQSENVKLRELVRDVYSFHWHGADCTECPWFDECDNHGGGCPWLGILANHMRELGIEVDE